MAGRCCIGLAMAKRKWVTPDNHPWREAARRAAQQKARKGGRATVVGLALRSALGAPLRLRRAALQAKPTTRNYKNSKGDISNEV